MADPLKPKRKSPKQRNPEVDKNLTSPKAVAARFKPGQSGNPGGGAKIKRFRPIILKILETDPDEVFVPKTKLEQMCADLVAVALSPNHGEWMRALTTIMERIDGKVVPSEEELESNRMPTIIIDTPRPIAP